MKRGPIPTNRHGGNVRQLALSAGIAAEDILDFSASINPLGLPEWFRPLTSRAIGSLTHYPDPDCSALTDAISSHYGVAKDEVIAGNGSTELLYLIPRVIAASRAIIPVPAYSDYARASELSGLTVEKVIMKEETGFRIDIPAIELRIAGNDIVFFGQPNNPTGVLCYAKELRNMALRNGTTTFVVDEAFADFVEGMDSLTHRRPANVIILLSFTKFFAIPGLRLGCAVADPAVVSRIREFMPPWSVNTFAQVVGKAALADAEYARKSKEYIRAERESLAEELRSIPGLYVYPGAANFLMVRIDRSGIDAPKLAKELIRTGIAIRVCENFDGLDSRFFRVAVRTAEENGRLCNALRDALGVAQKPAVRKLKPAIMFQGTSSNAGKSIMAAALCRILLQDGYSVAPFKAQNMSLNSYVTKDGGEMGRAQVVQAQACRIDPDVRMNPILLKPSSDTGAQVILMGKPVGNMDVDQYIRYKPEAFAAVKRAYDSLASEHDVIVLEGAGSPAEVNLKHHDIVNMTMASYARSPVILVGDIDRGGVFASFIGTMEVLAEWERALVAGFVINRFRGDKSLLDDAVNYVERYTSRPTFGVVPYLHDLGLPEEDSVSFKNGPRENIRPSGDGVEIALIDLPHISNFTDFDSLRLEPDVHLSIIREPRDMNNPDAIILPGSKNVIGDLDYLKKGGLAEKIASLAHNGKTEIVGICGGFQILGKEIADPHGIESAGRSIEGLGLLPVTTSLAIEKTLESVTARHIDSGLAVKGYEIHHGQTNGINLPAIVVREDGAVVGVKSDSGLLWGTYLHGIFDSDEFRRWFIDKLRVRRALPPLGKVMAAYDLEPAFDRLADVVRSSLNMEKIYRLLGLRRKSL
ncbi:MAG TPA: cobyric acid synthase [Syntrophales bacterium]|nr:cobyric acid synthase [Syntrophales bacterium]